MAVKSNEDVLRAWVTSAQAMIRNVKAHGDKVIVLRFEDLVGATEETMRLLSSRIGIRFEPALTNPSFLERPMFANSSFSAPQSGVIAAPLQRKALLSDDERAMIESICRETYEQAAALAADIRPAGPRMQAST
jgi:hypothetical protein